MGNGKAILIFGLLGLGLLFLLTRKSSGYSSYSDEVTIPFRPLGGSEMPLLPESAAPVKTFYVQDTKAPASMGGLLHYKNKETRNVEWNEDGLPTQITIEREYYQLP